MIRVKFFSDLSCETDIDEQINDFVEENDVQIVDVKFQTILYDGIGDYQNALLLYREYNRKPYKKGDE